MMEVLNDRPAGARASPAGEMPPRGFTPMKAHRYALVSLALAVAVLVVLPLVWAQAGRTAASPGAPAVRLVMFFGSMLALVTMMFSVGVAVTEQRMGVLWSGRNAYSLSRLQVVLWTMLVLSALAAVAACRAHGLFAAPGAAGMPTALNIEIPSELLLVMGISVASGAAAPAILSIKAQGAPVLAQQVNAAAARVGDAVGAVGHVLVRPDRRPPLIKDLFQGDEVAKAGTVDIGKLQQAIVTLILWGVYFGMLVEMFASGASSNVGKAAGSTAMPPMSEHFVYLLGISHAGYLAYKAAPSSTSADAKSPEATATTDGRRPSENMPRPLPPVIR